LRGILPCDGMKKKIQHGENFDFSVNFYFISMIFYCCCFNALKGLHGSLGCSVDVSGKK
jgi:hypothetical protein